jgi:2-polyprenyl-3-methyl-5-hydroxy-6-metoxy-1,4-benzoquinol methylase
VDVFAIDIPPRRGAAPRRRFRDIRFYDQPLHMTDVTLGAADLCVMDNVIEHVADPRAVLSSLRTYLRPGGRIVVITPNMDSGMFRLLGRRWTPELAPHAHIYLFHPRSMSECFARAGFTIETLGSFHDDPYPPSMWLRRAVAGDVKGALWRAHQELGAWYGRIIGAGPMLYAVARPAEVVQAEQQPNEVMVRSSA